MFDQRNGAQFLVGTSFVFFPSKDLSFGIELCQSRTVCMGIYADSKMMRGKNFALEANKIVGNEACKFVL